MPVTVGGSSLLIVSVKTCGVVWTPSDTLTVIVAVPNASGSGAIVSVRSRALPPRTRSSFRTSARFDDVAVSVSAAGAIRSSSIITGIGAMGSPT